MQDLIIMCFLSSHNIYAFQLQIYSLLGRKSDLIIFYTPIKYCSTSERELHNAKTHSELYRFITAINEIVVNKVHDAISPRIKCCSWTEWLFETVLTTAVIDFNVL